MKKWVFWSLFVMTFHCVANVMVVNRPTAFLWKSPDTIPYSSYYSIASMDNSASWNNVTNAIFSRWFMGKMESQLIYGEQAEVTEEKGNWVKVQVPAQRTIQYGSGYVGWILKSNLTNAEESNADKVLVKSKEAIIYKSTKLLSQLMTVYYGTKLSVSEVLSTAYRVKLVDGTEGIIKKSDVVLENTLLLTGENIVAEAKKFLSVRYLWAGTTPKGFDCSGLTFRVIHLLGGDIMRDAADQFMGGKSISDSEMLPGDLVFFASDGGKGKVHHVGIYIGNNSMIHSPQTGSTIRTEKINTKTWKASFAGARRYF